MNESEVSAARTRRNTVSDALRRSARRFGRKTALQYGDRSWSFHDIDRAVDRIAHRLLASGMVPGDRVAAIGRNSDAYLLLWLASTRAGLIHVPVNYALTGPELRYILSQSGARAVFSDPKLRDQVDAVTSPGVSSPILGTLWGGDALDILTIAMGAEQVVPFDGTADDGDVAQLLYTSGTTSAPKGAMMTHRALLSNYTSVTVELDCEPTDVSLAALPLYHTAQLHCFSMPQLLAGVTTLLVDTPDPALCLRLIEEHRITVFFAPPTVWISLLRHPDFDRRDLSSLTKLYYGASIMPLPVLEEIRQRLPTARPYNCYGQSEISPLATVLRPEDHVDHPASAGRPVYNVETRIVDADMRDVAAGEAGEIVHRSPQLMLGYWDKPEETAEAFSGGWFHSGDVGVQDEDGFITIVDRVKDVIKTGGVQVSSREVEEALFTHGAVSEVAVIALPDPKWIEAVTAVVVLRNGAQADAAELMEHCRSRLAPFKIPKRIFFRSDLPRNTAGKLLKRELRLEYQAG